MGVVVSRRGVSVSRLPGLCQRLNAPGGGFAIHALSGERVRDGFVVSIHPEREQYIGDRVDVGDVIAYAFENADLLVRAEWVLSCWRDDVTGVAHLDVSMVVYDRREAVRLCREYGQATFWDASTGRAVRVS